jgi:CHC2-type zinc finger protein
MNNNLVYDVKKIKSKASLDQVVSMYETINSEHKILCLWHDDHNPSMHIYENVGVCYACGTKIDSIAYIMKRENLSFLAATKFLADKLDILPEKVVTTTSTDYRGAVPSVWISHWHKQLTPEKREYLHTRLLTDGTLDSHMIGYDQEKEAYTIPFFRGYPGHSEIDIYQYRATPDKTWPDSTKPRRYWGKKGYNRPSVLGRHLINKELVIVLFGSIDQLNAEQDGLPAISLSAIEGFNDPDSDQCIELKRLLKDTKNIVILPDATLTEFAAASRLADLLGAKVCYFPKDCGVKDYNDWRISGRTAEEFILEVLEMNQYIYLIDQDHVGRTFDILSLISEGNGEGAFTVLQCMVVEGKYAVGAVSHALQMGIHRMPPPDIFGDFIWTDMAEEFYQSTSYQELAKVIKKYSDMANAKQGAF